MSGAFAGCKALTSVTLPDSLGKIEDYLFSGCYSLTAIKIPESVNKIGDYAFGHCTSLTSIIIPNSVWRIGEHAFQNCTSLTSIIIPDSVQRIGEYAFRDCKALQTVEIKGKPSYGDYSTTFLHTPYQEAIDQKGKSGCYIATAVYGSYDCPEVWALRRFRDNTLDRTWYGRAFIRTYYAVSPTLVRWFGKDSWFQALFRPLLDRLVVRLRQNGGSAENNVRHSQTGRHGASDIHPFISYKGSDLS